MRVWIAAAAIACSSCLLTSVAIGQRLPRRVRSRMRFPPVWEQAWEIQWDTPLIKWQDVWRSKLRMPYRQAVAGQEERVRPLRSCNTATASATTVAPPSGGSMIVSIQGAARPQPVCTPASQAQRVSAPAVANSGSATTPASPQAQVQTANCLTSADPTAFAHPSEITLPEMK